MANIIIEGEEFSPEEIGFQSTPTGNLIIEGEEISPEELGWETTQAQAPIQEQPSFSQPEPEQFAQPTVQGGQVTFEGQGQSPVKSAEVEVKPTVLTALNATGSLMPTADKNFAMPGMQNGAATFGGEQNVIDQPQELIPDQNVDQGVADPVFDATGSEIPENPELEKAKNRSEILVRADSTEIDAFNANERNNAAMFGTKPNEITKDEIDDNSAIGVFVDKLGSNNKKLIEVGLDNYERSFSEEFSAAIQPFMQHPGKTIKDIYSGLTDLAYAAEIKAFSAIGVDSSEFMGDKDRVEVRKAIGDVIEKHVVETYETDGYHGLELMAKNPAPILSMIFGNKLQGTMTVPVRKLTKFAAKKFASVTRIDKLIDEAAKRTSTIVTADATKGIKDRFMEIANDGKREFKTPGQWFLATGSDTKSAEAMLTHATAMKNKAILAKKNAIASYSKNNDPIKNHLAEKQIEVTMEEMLSEMGGANKAWSMSDEKKVLDKLQGLFNKNKSYDPKKINNLKYELKAMRESTREGIAKSRKDYIYEVKRHKQKLETSTRKIQSLMSKDINKDALGKINAIKEDARISIKKKEHVFESESQKVAVLFDNSADKIEKIETGSALSLEKLNNSISKSERIISDAIVKHDSRIDAINKKLVSSRDNLNRSLSAKSNIGSIQSKYDRRSSIIQDNINGLQDELNVLQRNKHVDLKEKNAFLSTSKKELKQKILDRDSSIKKINDDYDLAVENLDKSRLALVQEIDLRNDVMDRLLKESNEGSKAIDFNHQTNLINAEDNIRHGSKKLTDLHTKSYDEQVAAWKAFDQDKKSIEGQLALEENAINTKGLTMVELQEIQDLFTEWTDAYNANGVVKNSFDAKKAARSRADMARFLEELVKEEIPDLHGMNNDIRLASAAERMMMSATGRGSQAITGMDSIMTAALATTAGFIPAATAIGIKKSLRSPKINGVVSKFMSSLTDSGKAMIQDAFATGYIPPKAKVKLGMLHRTLVKSGIDSAEIKKFGSWIRDTTVSNTNRILLTEKIEELKNRIETRKKYPNYNPE